VRAFKQWCVSEYLNEVSVRVLSYVRMLRVCACVCVCLGMGVYTYE